MLKTALINPELMKAVSFCGHRDRILIADGNYPLASKSGDAAKIYLALEKDCPTATKVLEALRSVLNFEKAEVMTPDDDTVPVIFDEFKGMLGDIEFVEHERQRFYDECCKPDVKIAIMSGESRLFGNILLTVGVA